MADSTKKTPGTVPGPWFVDESCVSCGLCANEAPENFEMGDSFAFVKKQPSDPDEEAASETAMSSCPVQAIGKE
jgi:ferredoxin